PTLHLLTRLQRKFPTNQKKFNNRRLRRVMAMETHELEFLTAQFAEIKALLQKPAVDDAQLLTQEQLADKLQVTVASIINWRKRGRIPYVKIGSSPRYQFAAVIAALQKKK